MSAFDAVTGGIARSSLNRPATGFDAFGITTTAPSIGRGVD
jgi:hypothetical protein